MASLTSRIGLAPLALALLAAGCGDDAGSGTLTINYQFGAIGSTCSAEGVQMVRVTVGDIVEEEPCSDDGELTLASVPAGNYSNLLVEGLDAMDITIRDNLGNLADDEAVEVIGGSSTVKEVQLFPTPAFIELTFALNDETGLQLPSLDASEIDSFDVIATEGTNNVLLSGEVVIAQLQSARVTVDDPNRDLDGDRVNTVIVRSVVGNDSVQVDADPTTPDIEPFTFAPPGPGRVIAIRVECDGSMCSGELMGTDGGGDLTGGGSDTDGATSG